MSGGIGANGPDARVANRSDGVFLERFTLFVDLGDSAFGILETSR